jgi:sugar lactone lactonase YvrE
MNEVGKVGEAGGTAPVVCWSDRLELGEGIRWVDGRIVLVDILKGRLLAGATGQDPFAEGAGEDALAVIAELDVALGAVAPVAGRHGSWIAAAGTGICVLGPDGDVRWIARPEDANPVPMRMNDGTADPLGRFWAGSLAYGSDEGAGSLYRTDRDGTVTRVLDGITVPNGPVFSADGTTLFLADSAGGVIRSYPVDPVTGELGARSVFATLASGGPDGMAVDVEGGLWTAVWGEGVVHHYRADGTRDRVVRVPAKQPAGVCLGGEDGRTLYVTSARTGLANPAELDGAVFAVRVGVPGLATASFHLEDGA